jgi:hypothetical protein
VLVAALMASFATPIAAGVGTASASTGPTISTDQTDYPPGATVTLTGAGWQPGEAVALYVNDSVGSTWSWSDNVTADSTGAFTDSFQLPNWFVANYTATATGAQSGTATTTFTDSVKLQILGGLYSTAPGQDLGPVTVGSALSLTCPPGTGLTISAPGLGSGSLTWNLNYVLT